MNRLITIIIVLVLSFSVSFAGEPERNKGISVHALPKRVAKISGSPWGFQVSYAPYLKAEPGQPYLQTLEDVLTYVKKQDKSVIENGLWVVTTNPSSYSEEEIELQNLIKSELPKHNIPLFWVRGTELSNGFTRY
ncbi:MAG: hypothetical protein AB2659_14670 [Candidatus Thiodiazotropha sp.]|nr:hypothetical protein [Candidatus Thiodiazotropha taylori]